MAMVMASALDQVVVGMAGIGLAMSRERMSGGVRLKSSGLFSAGVVEGERRWNPLCRRLLGPEHVSFEASGLAGRASSVFASLAVQAKSPPITLHVGETSFTLPFSTEAAKGLNAAIDGLFLTFKEREKATRPQRWKNMEYRHTGEDSVFFEVFSNPNAYSSAFQAKVLITINDEKIKITSEGQLSALKADIDEYIIKNN